MNVTRFFALGLLLSVGAVSADTQLTGTMTGSTGQPVTGQLVLTMNNPVIFAGKGLEDGRSVVLQMELIQETGTAAHVQCTVAQYRSNDDRQPQILPSTALELQWGVDMDVALDSGIQDDPFVIKLNAIPSFIPTLFGDQSQSQQ